MNGTRRKIVPKIVNERLEQKYFSNLKKIIETLNRIEKIAPWFGKQYHKM